MSSPKKAVRVAGAFYVALVVLVLIGSAVGSQVHQGSGLATAPDIRSATEWFRLSLVTGLVTDLFFLLTAMALYAVFRQTSPMAAGAMVVFVAVSTAASWVVTLNDFTAMTIATNDSYAKALGQDGAGALVALFGSIQQGQGESQAMFWGLWLLPLAYLIIRSKLFPKALGIIVGMAGTLWIAQFLVYFLAPGWSALESFLGIAAFGEFAFIAWLLVGPVRSPAGVEPVMPAAGRMLPLS